MKKTATMGVRGRLPLALTSHGCTKKKDSGKKAIIWRRTVDVRFLATLVNTAPFPVLAIL
jgi:hypothetical protein